MTPLQVLGKVMAALTCAAVSQSAGAWSQDGHMVSGAIAYEELRERDPHLIDIVLELMAQHPDRGTFEVAAGGATGETRARRLFMEMARWPDDIRKGTYDHPTWHYASRPLIDSQHPPPVNPRDVAAGSAREAFALNVSTARDARAGAPERAMALCWIFHLVGDIHQPLHAADAYSAAYPQGDHGGGLQFVKDPPFPQPLSLHWYWDQAATRDGMAAAERAAELRSALPREKFAELSQPPGNAQDFDTWTAESYALARSQVYRPDLATSTSELQAPELSAAYRANSRLVAVRRLTLSGYRLADLLTAILHES